MNAAEICFARTGFHRTTMQDLAKEARISLGAIYVYFNSKEALIEGLIERDRAMLGDDLAQFAEAPDLIAALHSLGEIYTVQRPRHKQILHIEIGVESTRNEQIGEIFRSVDCFCQEGFERVLTQAAADGRIAPTTDIKKIAKVMSLIGDGMFWRTAVEPDFDAKALLPLLTDMISALIKPTGSDAPEAQQDPGAHETGSPAQETDTATSGGPPKSQVQT